MLDGKGKMQPVGGTVLPENLQRLSAHVQEIWVRVWRVLINPASRSHTAAALTVVTNP